MKCLAVNTANMLLSVALVEDEKILHYFEAAETRDQGNLLLQHMGLALANNSLTYHDIDVLGVVTGPGSFTGIRIGLAALRGIALAAEKPVLGVTSFDLFSCGGDCNAIAVESWREELYCEARGVEGAVIIPAVNEKPEDFAARLSQQGIIVSGDAAEKLLPFLPGAVQSDKKANAVDVARIVLERYGKSGGTHEKPLPYYLRPADVTISHRKTRQIETK